MEVRRASSLTILENKVDEKEIIVAGRDAEDRSMIVSLIHPAFNPERIEALLHTGIISQSAILENGKYSQWDVTVRPEFSKYPFFLLSINS